jgi:hypothetical protein
MPKTRMISQFHSLAMTFELSCDVPRVRHERSGRRMNGARPPGAAQRRAVGGLRPVLLHARVRRRRISAGFGL